MEYIKGCLYIISDESEIRVRMAVILTDACSTRLSNSCRSTASSCTCVDQLTCFYGVLDHTFGAVDPWSVVGAPIWSRSLWHHYVVEAKLRTWRTWILRCLMHVQWPARQAFGTALSYVMILMTQEPACQAFRGIM